MSIANTNIANSFPANLKSTWRFDNAGNLGHIIGGTGNINIKGATVSGNISATGNITAPNITASTGAFYGNAAGLTNIPGANVTGTVANATYALNAGNANIANTAYSVSAANVSGLGNIATINLDGNASNLLNGAGSFVAIPTNVANANYANFAGTVLTNAQPNITSVGTLTGLNVSSNSNIFIQTTASNLTTESSLTNYIKVVNTSNVAGGGTVQQQYYNTVTEQASFVGAGENGIQMSIANTNIANSFPGNLKTVWRVDNTGNIGHIIGGIGNVNAKGATISGNIAATGNVTAGNGNIILNTNGTISYLRTFGSFTSNATQTSNGANTTNYMTFNNTEVANGVSIVSSSQLTVSRTGNYNIQFSAQVSHDTNATANIEIWLTKNGSAVANTNSRLTLVKDQPTIAAWNFVDSVTSANTYYQIAWASPDVNMELLAYDTANTLAGVAIPSVIATVTPVGA